MELFTTEQLERCEGSLAQGAYEEILPRLQDMSSAAQAFIDETYEPTNEVQWFSFSSQFELLTYKRVENDPREIRPAAAPFDRLFADTGFCLLQLSRFEEAAESLKQAVRWNPMECAHRLNLASALAQMGDYEEYLRMTYSVFDRASRSVHLARAYENFAGYFIDSEMPDTAAACVKCGLALVPEDKRLLAIGESLATNHQRDYREQSDELTESLLDEQGIPTGANVEVAISALLLADIATANGDEQTAMDMNAIAVDLMGEERAVTLSRMIAEADEDDDIADARDGREHGGAEARGRSAGRGER
jgi:tetratricopeptide (TPR) repeat protein